MKNQEVRWWLIGFFELCDQPFDRKRLFIVKNHLDLARAVDSRLDETNELIYRKITELIATNATDEALAAFKQWLHNLILRRITELETAPE